MTPVPKTKVVRMGCVAQRLHCDGHAERDNIPATVAQKTKSFKKTLDSVARIGGWASKAGFYGGLVDCS